MTHETALLLTQLVSTLMMAGLIWFVQVVHYPLFKQVGEREFPDYEEMHIRSTGRVVAPLMATEAIAAILICIELPQGVSLASALTGAVLVLVIWLSTVSIQVPCHRLLASGCDEQAWQLLVRSNWVRTAAWTARVMIALWMLVSYITAIAIP